MSDALNIERDGHVAVVVMNRPPHNFLDIGQVHAIGDAFDEIDAEPELRAIVLAAEGRSFCAGADFGGGGLGGSTSGDKDSMFGDGRQSPTAQLYAGAARLFGTAKPVFCAVQGPAIGGGLGLAMVGDWRVTCPEARFSANFTKLGIHQGFGLSVSLPEALGRRRAAEVLLYGRRYNGEQALEIGLADECVPLDEVRSRAVELAGELAENAPLSVMSVRATLRQGLVERITAATVHEAAEQARLSKTNDAAEGIKAVSERRPGNFTAS
jgi:enoyl-CoA hydratase/carnithine racemase